jgi:hypothetical protein
MVIDGVVSSLLIVPVACSEALAALVVVRLTRNV